MTTPGIVADSWAEESIAVALTAVQEIHDGAMALFARMYQDWVRASRETLGQSSPSPSAQDVPQAA